MLLAVTSLLSHNIEAVASLQLAVTAAYRQHIATGYIRHNRLQNQVKQAYAPWQTQQHTGRDLLPAASVHFVIAHHTTTPVALTKLSIVASLLGSQSNHVLHIRQQIKRFLYLQPQLNWIQCMIVCPGDRDDCLCCCTCTLAAQVKVAENRRHHAVPLHKCGDIEQLLTYQHWGQSDAAKVWCIPKGHCAVDPLKAGRSYTWN